MDHRLDAYAYTIAALAAQPQGAAEVSDNELIGHYCDARRKFYFEESELNDPVEERKAATLAGLRAILARYGTTPQPIPVAERLPEAKDLSPGECLWTYSTKYYPGVWELMQIDSMNFEYHGIDYWLPHWALPIPQAGEVQS